MSCIGRARLPVWNCQNTPDGCLLFVLYLWTLQPIVELLKFSVSVFFVFSIKNGQPEGKFRC